MNRMYVATVVAAVAVLAMPALARDGQADLQNASGTPAAEAGGAPMALPAEQRAVPVRGAAVSGEVVFATPAELVVHTAKGLQFFEITPRTEMASGAAQGEDVTVVYRPIQGSVRHNVVGRAATGRANAKVAGFARAVVPAVAGR